MAQVAAVAVRLIDTNAHYLANSVKINIIIVLFHISIITVILITSTEKLHRSETIKRTGVSFTIRKYVEYFTWLTSMIITPNDLFPV